MARTIEFRNGANYIWGRIAVAEISFAALVVTSLVEAIFRGILAIPGVLIVYADLAMLESEQKQLIITATVAGSVISTLNSVVALMALFKNLFERRVDYDEIFPALTMCVAQAEPLLRTGLRLMNGNASFLDLVQGART
ncbi:MAG: hypothetical protein ACHQT8_01150 [Chlamydiales bacterium]